MYLFSCIMIVQQDLNIFVPTQISRFGRKQCIREGFTQSFINEAPGHGCFLRP